MGECIEREAVLRAVQGQRSPCRSPAQNRMLDCLKAAVIRISAADVAPVIRATWVLTTDFGPSELYHCSRCGREEVRFGKSSIYKQYPYCHCGAKMDGGAA